MTINHIRTVGFKGFDLDENVPQKVIYIGRNKAGKSTRADAIAIAVYGYIPFSAVGKRPSDILDSFGKDHLIVSITTKGTEFARKFSRNSKGGVSQSFQVDKKRASSENFAILLNKSGAPRIADVSEFMKQSDAKKTDTLFELFPNKDLSGIDTEIEIAKEDVSRLTRKKDGAESVVVTLTNSKQAMEIPAGNIAETQAEIKKVEEQISDYEEQIKQAEIEEDRVKNEQAENDRTERAADKAKHDAGVSRHEILKKIGVDLDISTCSGMDELVWVEFFDGKNSEYQSAQNKIWIEEQKKKKEDAKIEEDRVEAENFNDPINKIISKGEQEIENFKENSAVGHGGNEGHSFIDDTYPEIEDRSKSISKNGEEQFGKSDSGVISPRDLQRVLASQSIQKIIKALKGSGCGTCAALIVAKQELKKYKGIS